MISGVSARLIHPPMGSVFFSYTVLRRNASTPIIRVVQKKVIQRVSFFEAMKQHADGTRVRVWNADTLRGRMFIQSVSLCYYEYLNEEIRKLKNALGKENGDAVHDTRAVLDNELKLKSWLCNTPLYLQLQWFDTVESVDVSAKLKRRRRTTEITSRDALYLQKLGVNIR